jgi:hypothetical protein
MRHAQPARLQARHIGAILIASWALILPACSNSEAPIGSVELVPSAGGTAAGGLDVAMRAEELVVEAAGDQRDGAGHFHLIVDSDCAPEGKVLVADANHIDVADGATTATVYLEPGEHELCLQFADGSHAATDVIDRATVTAGVVSVEEWCSVIDEVDALFAQTDNSADPFEVKQIGYENIGRLFAQVSTGLTLLDPDDREAVAADINFGVRIITALTQAADEQAAQAAFDTIVQDSLVGEGVQARQQFCAG